MKVEDLIGLLTVYVRDDAKVLINGEGISKENIIISPTLDENYVDIRINQHLTGDIMGVHDLFRLFVVYVRDGAEVLINGQKINKENVVVDHDENCVDIRVKHE